MARAVEGGSHSSESAERQYLLEFLLFLNEMYSKNAKLLGIFVLAGFLLLADHQVAPYDPVVGERNRIESPLGQSLLWAGVQYQNYHLENDLDPKETFLGRSVHISPRLSHTFDWWGYLKEYFNDTRTKPRPEGTLFSESFTSVAPPELPVWFPPEISVAILRDANNQHLEIVTMQLMKDATFSPLIAQEIVGAATAPTLYLAWPSPEGRVENTFAFGTDPRRSHGNGTAVSIEFMPGVNACFGGGWHQVSKEFPFKAHPDATLRHGMVVPNNYADSGTGALQWDENGKMHGLTEFAGDVHDPDYPPTAILMHDGTITVLVGKEIAPYLEGEVEGLKNAVLLQVAYSIPHSENISLLNEMLNAPSELERNSLLDFFNASLPHGKLPGLDVVWLTVMETESLDGTRNTYISFALNRSEESENTSGSDKVTASISELVKKIKKDGKPGDRIISATTIHTGAQGSTGNVIFTNGTTSPPPGIPSNNIANEELLFVTPDGRQVYTTLPDSY